jgi:hypothetical protein
MTSWHTPSEFERLKGGLYERLENFTIDGVSDDKLFSIISKMYEHVDSARSVDTIRIYDRLLLQQTSLYKLNLLATIIKVWTINVRGLEPISHIVTQDLIDRVATFDFALSKEDGGYHFYSDVRSDLKIARYLDMAREAVILGDHGTLNYVTGNFESVFRFIKEHDLNDPAALLESIRIMQNGATALAGGAL